MYVSPSHPNPPKKSAPPVDRGRRLATCERQDDELRMSLDWFNERPYLALRVWERDKQTGAMWPTRKGVSIRLGELQEILSGLRHLEELIDRGEVQLPRREFRQLAKPGPHVNRRPVAGAQPTHLDPVGAGEIAPPPWDEQKPKFVDKRRQGPKTWTAPQSAVPRGYLGAAEFDEFAAE